MRSFKIGDVVELMSGGQNMTVYGEPQKTDIGIEGARCMWFDAAGHLQTEFMPFDVLQLADPRCRMPRESVIAALNEDRARGFSCH